MKSLTEYDPVLHKFRPGELGTRLDKQDVWSDVRKFLPLVEWEAGIWSTGIWSAMRVRDDNMHTICYVKCDVWLEQNRHDEWNFF